MLSITHIVVSLLLIQLMALDRNDAFVALLFGVFIDVDHLFGLVKYTEAKGIAAIFDFHTLMNPGGQWKSMLHTPMAAAVVMPLSAVSRLFIPFLFWLVHMLMDYVEGVYLGNFSGVEAGLLVFAGLGLVTLRYGHFIMSDAAPSFSGYLKCELNEARNLFRTKARTAF